MSHFLSEGFIALAVIMPIMRLKWVTTPTRNHHFFFQKNAQNVDTSGTFPYPPQTSDVHYEMELVVALKSGGADISLDAALEHVYGYGLGLDMTRRDLQGEAKKLGRPWEVGKSFEKSAPDDRACPSK